MAEPMVAVEGLRVDLGGSTVLSEVSFRVEKDSFSVVLGPNGSGKTTLIRSLYRAVNRRSGTIRIAGRDIDDLQQRELGQRIAVLRQETEPAFDFLVEELVLMGRSPFKGLFDPDGPDNLAIVDEVLELTDTSHLKGRSFAALSGGEQQRVLLARALAQRPSLLLLDEPTNHLDIRHQLEVLECVRGLGITVFAALHDLNLADAFASDVVLLVEGSIRAKGPPGDVLTQSLIEEAFGVQVERVSRSRGSVLAFDTKDSS